MQEQEMLKKSWETYKALPDQHRVERSFTVEGRVWLLLNKERLQGSSKKIKVLRYGSLKMFEKVGDVA